MRVKLITHFYMLGRTNFNKVRAII